MFDKSLCRPLKKYRRKMSGELEFLKNKKLNCGGHFNLYF